MTFTTPPIIAHSSRKTKSPISTWEKGKNEEGFFLSQAFYVSQNWNPEKERGKISFFYCPIGPDLCWSLMKRFLNCTLIPFFQRTSWHRPKIPPSKKIEASPPIASSLHSCSQPMQINYQCSFLQRVTFAYCILGAAVLWRSSFIAKIRLFLLIWLRRFAFIFESSEGEVPPPSLHFVAWWIFL